jgi:hypothetical protein
MKFIACSFRAHFQNQTPKIEPKLRNALNQAAPLQSQTPKRFSKTSLERKFFGNFSETKHFSGIIRQPSNKTKN